MDMAKGLPEKPDNCLGTYGARTHEEVLVRVWGIFPHFQYIVLSAFVAKIEDFAHSFYILKSTESICTESFRKHQQQQQQHKSNATFFIPHFPVLCESFLLGTTTSVFF